MVGTQLHIKHGEGLGIGIGMGWLLNSLLCTYIGERSVTSRYFSRKIGKKGDTYVTHNGYIPIYIAGYQIPIPIAIAIAIPICLSC